MATNSKIPPSARWSSYDPWNYGGMKERLESIMTKLNTATLVQHAEQVLNQKVILSKPFSAGQYWACFEMVAEDESLIIARVRLPKHPDTPAKLSEEDEAYSVGCEVATMAYIGQSLTSVKLPHVHAYEAAGSNRASALGAPYMLIEGFYGNTLQDVEFDICDLPLSTQEHIITQWTRAQAEIATLAFPCIGSISSISPTGEPIIGRLATAGIDGLDSHGPFSSAVAYFGAIAEAVVRKEKESSTDRSLSWAGIGAFVFRDIVYNTALYQSTPSAAGDDELFPLSHMDLGTQNILVDDNFNFLAIIDWEFAQTAPWPVNYYPMPFPLTDSDVEIQAILQDPTHLAHENVSRQEAARKLYTQKFREAETELREQGRALTGSFSNVLDGPASRTYACFSRLGRMPAADEQLVREMVRLAFGDGLSSDETERYLQGIKAKM